VKGGKSCSTKDALPDYLRQAYRSSIGRPPQELVTPALILDLDVARRNIQFMADRLRGMKAKLRPHIKVQKSTELAKLQVAAGAIGVCTATVWEAIAMREAGITDVLIANQVVGPEKIKALAEAARQGGLSVVVDDVRNARDLSDAAVAARSRLDVLIEVDVGMSRGGVRSPEEALELTRSLARLPALRFRGVQGYEGHCMLEPDRAARIAKCHAALEYLSGVVALLKEAGFPSEVVSAGGTGTYDITGNDPRVTEIQAGSYVFMDNFHGNLVPGFSHSLTVLGTVVIHHGWTIVLDSGRKSIGIDFVQPTLVEYPFYPARYFAEEHALFDVDERCGLTLGDRTELIPGYAPSTVNLYDVYHVVEGGVVADIWPIFPRGPGHNGLAVS
jgi:D-serine deaminase-like pyridoxal phosphate-dependent protein